MVWLEATRPLQKHSWHIWKLWHFWQRYRNPLKLSRRQASQVTGWVTKNYKSINTFLNGWEKKYVPFSTLDKRCNKGNHTRQAGPGSDIIESIKSLTVTLPFYNQIKINELNTKNKLRHNSYRVWLRQAFNKVNKLS